MAIRGWDRITGPTPPPFGIDASPGVPGLYSPPEAHSVSNPIPAIWNQNRCELICRYVPNKFGLSTRNTKTNIYNNNNTKS